MRAIDYITQQLQADAGQQGAMQQGVPSYPPQEMGAGAPGPGPQPGQGQVDPRLDYIAKQLATLQGSPQEKYAIFVNLIPQLIEMFAGGGGQPQGTPGTGQAPPGGEYMGGQ